MEQEVNMEIPHHQCSVQINVPQPDNFHLNINYNLTMQILHCPDEVGAPVLCQWWQPTHCNLWQCCHVCVVTILLE